MTGPDQYLEAGGRALEVRSQDVLAQWQSHMHRLVAAGELAQATAGAYARGMRSVVAWCSENGVDQVTSVEIRRWKAERLEEVLSPAGVNLRFAGVRSFYRWAVQERGLSADPTAGVRGASRRGSSRTHKREPLSDQVVLRLLEQPDADAVQGKRDRALLYLMVYTGVRTIEVQRATIADLRSNTHCKLAIQGKGHADADEVVYLVNGALLDALYAWLAAHPRGDDPKAPLFCGLGNRNRGGPLCSRSLRGLIKGYMRQAGIRDPLKTAHSLRHTVVTNLIRHGVAPTQIMSVTRHRSLDTLLAYAHEVAREDDPAEGYVGYGEG